MNTRFGALTAAVISFVLGLVVAPSALAVKFSNQFVEFELPLKWNCSLEGAEWVCQSQDEAQKRDAIVVLAAKLKGDQDTLDKYQEYLSKPRSFNSPVGKSVTSAPKYAKQSQINAHPWVDSIHMESEIPGFYTRYLATVKQDIGVLVTYSINKNKYQEYLAQFDDMVKSLKVFRKANAPINSGPQGDLFKQAQLPGSFTAGQVFPDQPAQPAQQADASKKKKEEDNSAMLLIVAIIGVVGFIIYKKRKSGGA